MLATYCISSQPQLCSLCKPLKPSLLGVLGGKGAPAKPPHGLAEERTDGKTHLRFTMPVIFKVSAGVL